MLIRPQVQIARDELAALIDTIGTRVAHLAAHPIHRGDDIGTRYAGRGSMTGTYREYLSITVKMRSLPPVASWSCTKSIAHTSFEREGGVRSARKAAFTRRLGVLLRNCRPNSLYTRRVLFSLITYPRYLLRLVEAEIIERERRMVPRTPPA